MKRFMIVGLALTITACSDIPRNIDGNQGYFEFDSAEISRDTRKELIAQSRYMKVNPDHNITIEGNCDERGSTEYNLALGALRAGNAKHVIIKEGIESERIKTVSYGKERPQYLGTGEEVWQKNRNVTTRIK